LLADRLDSVLAVIYLIFTEGYAATTGEALIRHELCDEALRLCRVLELLIRQARTDVPAAQQAETLGLLALMRLHHSRRAARVGPGGELIVLDQQDRALWDRRDIQEGLAILDEALLLRQPGRIRFRPRSAPYTRALPPPETDWAQITALYGELRHYMDTAVIRLNQAVAASLAIAPHRLALAGCLPALNAYAPFHGPR
jgi:RNA polymerase sigma-70 factor (ECF subfamily)